MVVYTFNPRQRRADFPELETSLGYAENLVLKYKQTNNKREGGNRGVFTMLVSLFLTFHPSSGKANSLLGLPEDILVAPRREVLSYLLLTVFRGQ